MGTTGKVKGKRAQVDTDRKAQAAAGSGSGEFVKARETISRPPLPAPGLYDAYLTKAPAPIPIRRPSETADETPHTTAETAPETRQAALMVSSADALAALEAWSSPSPRHKPKATLT